MHPVDVSCLRFQGWQFNGIKSGTYPIRREPSAEIAYDMVIRVSGTHFEICYRPFTTAEDHFDECQEGTLGRVLLIEAGLLDL